jgi:hypothetical protein
MADFSTLRGVAFCPALVFLSSLDPVMRGMPDHMAYMLTMSLLSDRG